MSRRHNSTGRSTARRADARHGRISGAFVPRTLDMLESPALRALSLSARRVLDRIEIELCRHAGGDNGRLPVTFADFAAYGIDRHAIAPALREAEALGFIEITERGRAGNAEYRSPNMFRLTYRHTAAAPPTDEWSRIETMDDAERIAKTARKKKIPSGGKHQKSVGETHTESGPAPVGETPTTPIPEKPPLLSISTG